MEIQSLATDEFIKYSENSLFIGNKIELSSDIKLLDCINKIINCK